jgi:hypothetical protein
MQRLPHIMKSSDQNCATLLVPVLDPSPSTCWGLRGRVTIPKGREGKEVGNIGTGLSFRKQLDVSLCLKPESQKLWKSRLENNNRQKRAVKCNPTKLLVDDESDNYTAVIPTIKTIARSFRRCGKGD